MTWRPAGNFYRRFMLETPSDPVIQVDSSELRVTAALPLAPEMLGLHMPANKSQFGFHTINNM
jgi:hypothetical protein